MKQLIQFSVHFERSKAMLLDADDVTGLPVVFMEYTSSFKTFRNQNVVVLIVALVCKYPSLEPFHSGNLVSQ